jgi:hypothetical protein
MKTEIPTIELLSSALPKLSGKLWIVDPCYVVPDELWNSVCGQMFSEKFKNCSEYLFRSCGMDFFVIGTAYGDGTYPVYRNGVRIGSCGVDAGLLSAIPVELVQIWRNIDSSNQAPEKLGVLVDVGDRPRQVRLLRNEKNDRRGDWGIGKLIEVYTSEEDPYRPRNDDYDDNEDENY